MQTLLFDFLPVLLFFIIFKFYGIYAATLVGIITTGLQVLLTRFFKKKFDKQQLITFIVFVVFGGMTLYFHNPIFVKWKPTIIFWIFAFIFLVTQFFGRHTLIERMLSHIVTENIPIPKRVWKKLNLAWFLFFVLLGGINLYIAYNYSLAFWVNFKVFGILILLIVFSLLQTVYLAKFIKSE